MSDHIKQQNPPEPGDETVIEHVMSDLLMRAYVGKAQYGTLLQTNNGRDPLVDAYQEALDMCMYLKQALLERDEQIAKRTQIWNDGEYIVEIVNGVWHTRVKT